MQRFEQNFKCFRLKTNSERQRKRRYYKKESYKNEDLHSTQFESMEVWDSPQTVTQVTLRDKV